MNLLNSLELNQTLTKTQSQYNQSLRSVARGLWNGSLDISGFTDGLSSAINRGFNQAWIEGLAKCGILPDEVTAAEQKALSKRIAKEQQFVFEFGEWIEENSKANGGKLGTIIGRLSMWTNRYSEVISMAQTFGCGNQKLVWRYDPTKEHCRDCRRLNGKVYRASTWQTIGILPQSSSLACKGFRCGCVLEITTLPISRGRRLSI